MTLMTNNISNLKDNIYNGAKNKSLEISDLVLDRISEELNVIETKGFIDYFILYSRIIEICNELKLIRSYGRGSAPNSLVNYCLDITNINPLEHNFRFERFIHPLQTRLPDIDLDVPLGSEELVILELKNRYPEYQSYSIVNIPNSANKSYEDVYINNQNYKKHPSGIIISKDIISQSTKTVGNKDFYICEDYSNDPQMEHKFDFVELSCLKHYQNVVNEIGDQYHPYQIALNDEAVMEVFKTGDTKSIYNFNSDSMQQILRQFKPHSIEDLAVLFTMHRPPLEKWIPSVIKGKFENNKFKWSDQRIEGILAETYGLVIYQETFLDILIDIAGMTFFEAHDWLRTLTYKNSKEFQALFIMEFSNKCFENTSLDKVEIARLSSLLLDTVQWTFQKTHALSHTIMAYWGAYYKFHFSLEF